MDSKSRGVTALSIACDRSYLNTEESVGIYVSYVKRAIDVIIASVALVVCLPLLFVVGMLICLDSPGKALYRQKRVGLDGKVFHIYKLRTMRSGTEKEGFRTGEQDKRITRLGHFLRNNKIDELPQLLNIIKGEMTIIGPRPLSQDETEHIIDFGFSPDYAGFLHRVQPGLIGLEQLRPDRMSLSYAERFKLNHEYEMGISWQLDLHIFRTALNRCRYVCSLLTFTAISETIFLACAMGSGMY